VALLGASFQIGRSALAAYQSAISIAGQNIANLANPDYARQSGRLAALVGGPLLGGVTPGAGVQLDRLRRHVDGSLDAQLRNAGGARSSADTVYQALSQLESRYNELTDQDISSLLATFFSQFATLETSPSDGASRDQVLSTARGLAQSVQRQRAGILQQVQDLNTQAETLSEHASGIAREIASLNELIVRQEADGTSIASPLRDRRDGLLRELSEIVDVRVREQDSGAVNVYVGSTPLVEFNRARTLTTERVLEDGMEIARVRFADDGSGVTLSGGALHGVVTARDVHLRGQLDRLDQFARGLIYEVNRIHSTGVGLVGYSSLRSEHAVLDPDAALNTDQAGLPFPARNGTFIVHVRDTATGQVITRQIEIDLDGLGGNDTSLADLAEDLGNVPGLTASVTADNRLQINAGNGREVWFTEDSSGLLAALGVASFFSGTNAADIRLSETIASDPRLLAASTSGLVNDGGNAGRIATLADDARVSDLLSGRSIAGYFDDIVGSLAVSTAQAMTDFEAADAVYSGVYAQRESVSGVNLDEETVKLMEYQSAYEGAARYIGVLDQLNAELLSLLS
jgi:flagellar hook-associated protein 1 FlgK